VKPFDLLRHAVRAKEILTTLARHGFNDLLDQIELPPGFLQKLLAQPGPSRTTEERARLAAEELGPAFVKLGQLLSMRPDVLPHAMILELRKLQDQVQPLPFSDLGPVLNSELGRDPHEVFSEFNETPIASASLAQVYFARLRAGGEPVAVKIQKPDIHRTIEVDMELAGWLAGQLQQRIGALKAFDLPGVVEEARLGILREIDFRNEARNLQYFAAQNPSPGEVFAPRVLLELSTARVLVMEHIDGDPVGATTLPAAQLRLLAAHGAGSLIRQVLVSGFFHADPHAGNVFITRDGRLCFLDWGLVGHLTRRLRYALADFWVAAVEQDAEWIVQIAAELAPAEARPDLHAMEKEVTLALREELNFTIGRQQIGRALLKLLYIFGQYGIPLSRDYSLMAKAVLSIEEVGRTLDPGFDLRVHTEPVLRELFRERYSGGTLFRRLRTFLRGGMAGMQNLPAVMHRLVRRLENDNLIINLRHRGLEEHDDAMKIAANRIALGVIIGALIIGSSLIVTTGTGPQLLGYPTLGIIGYLLSAILGLYVIWDIIRHGRHK